MFDTSPRLMYVKPLSRETHKNQSEQMAAVFLAANMANERGRRGGRAGAKSGKAGGRGKVGVFIMVVGKAQRRDNCAIRQVHQQTLLWLTLLFYREGEAHCCCCATSLTFNATAQQ